MRFSVCVAFVLMAGSAVAQSPNATISGPVTMGYLAAGLGLPLLRDGSRGGDRSLRTFDSLAITLGLTEGLKTLVRERRPDGSDFASFPSGHASLAFCAATMQAQFHPGEAAYWYVGATIIGASRVALRKHRWFDVVAGAALGYGVARLELSSDRGLLLAPTGAIREDSRLLPSRGYRVEPWIGRGWGLMVSGRL